MDKLKCITLMRIIKELEKLDDSKRDKAIQIAYETSPECGYLIEQTVTVIRKKQSA